MFVFQKKEYHLSQESKMHFSNGFVQVPIRETKELFGIKFSNPLDGETFYGRVTEAMGQSCRIELCVWIWWGRVCVDMVV